MYMTSLNASDRDFFRHVYRAAFANPFTDVRSDADKALSGLGDAAGHEAHIEAMLANVSTRVARLEADGQAVMTQYAGEDRELMLIALLFDAFHRMIDDFDELIRHQLAAGDTPVRVSFAQDAFALLASRGYSQDGIRHFFAMFHQLRRAYYFIARDLSGSAPCMQEFRRRLWNNIFTHDVRNYVRILWNRMEDYATLFLGETGTGKGTAAAAVGRSGYIPFDDRKGRFEESFTRCFVSINLSQYPATLLESELFGHRKGAFTGAVDHHDGVFARCSPYGAIFLDEIGEIEPSVQVKLLQVLQERTFSPVGSHETLRFRGRVIAATNRSLDQLRGDGQFREDFYYRLCSDVLEAPPLGRRFREDEQEFDALIRLVLRRVTGEEDPRLTRTVRDALQASPGLNYPWPGNVREFEQAVRRILLSRRYEPASPASSGADWTTRAGRGELTARALLSSYCNALYERYQTYERVAEITDLDRRTVKKYVDEYPAS